MMEIGSKADVPGAVVFFRRSPFRWQYFLADTVILMGSIGVGVFVMIRYRDRLPATTEIILAAVIIGMLLMWRAALHAHSRIHQFYQAGEVSDQVSGPPLEAALRVAASMIHLGLFYTFLLVALVLMQLDRVLTRR